MVNVHEWLNGIPSEPGDKAAIRELQSVHGQLGSVAPAWGQRYVAGKLNTHSLGTHSRIATDDTAFSEAQQLLRRVRLEDQLSVTTEQAPPPPVTKPSRWQEVKQQNLRGGLVTVSALHDAEARLKSHEQLAVPGMAQHSSVSEDRLEQLMASLNKAREHSEQYARCRLELREVENEPPISSVARNTVDTIGKGPSEAQAQRVPGGTARGSSTAKIQAADEPPFLVARGFPARPRCDAMRNNACGHSKGGPPAPASHTGGVPTVCDTPTPAPPDAAPHDARKPLSPLDSPYYGKYMHSSGKAQPALWEAAAQLGAEKDPTVGCATACGPTSSAISSCIPKPELRSADLSVEHYVPKLQYLRQGGHLGTPDAVEKVTAWLQPAEGHDAGPVPPSHVQHAPSTRGTFRRSDKDMGVVGNAAGSVGQQEDDDFAPMAQARNSRFLSAQAEAGMQFEGLAYSMAAQDSDEPGRKNVHTADEVEFCITSSGFKVARTRTQDVECDSARRGPSHYPQQVSRHPSLPRQDSPPALTTQDTRSDHAMHAAAVRHRADYLIGSCFNAWRRWTTGMRAMMAAASQQAISLMAAFTARRVLAAWKGHAVAIAAERDAEAERLCKLRVQEARKTEIASKFHRVWQLHFALKAWQAAARESMSARAAQAQAALQEAAIAARMEIAAQFHNNFQLHAAMDAWRRVASSLQQERQASHQAQVVQSRIDAVLARVKAGQRDEKSPWSRSAAAERGTASSHAVAADSHTAHRTSDAGQQSDVKGNVTDECAMEVPRPSVHSEDDARPVSTAGGSERAHSTSCMRGAGKHSFAMTSAEDGLRAVQSRDTEEQMNGLTPYPEVEWAVAGGSGGHSSGTSAAQTQDGAGLMHPSILPEEERPSARDCSDSLSQQNQSTRDVDKKLASERDSLCLDTVGPDARAAAASQPSADPQEWDLYVKYINHQVIQGHGDRIAADPGSQDTQPVLLSAKPKSTVHAQRFEKRQGKRIQAELEAQLAQVEAAAESSRRKKEEARRKHVAQILREEISVAKENHRLSCLWRHGWRPWRMAVEARRRSLRKVAKHRQCNRMRSVLAALALHALRSRMKETLTELVGTVSLRNKLAQGRQRRAFNAWLQLASAMHWRRNRMQTLCWLAWQAQAVAARRSLWKAKQRHHSWRLRLGMRAWKVAYTQVLDQRLLIESMAMDMAVVHSRSAILRRAVSGWHREAANAANAREQAERHTAMWSKVSTWLQQPEGGSDRQASQDGPARIGSKVKSPADTCVSNAIMQPWQPSTAEKPGGLVSGIQNEAEGIGHAGNISGESGALGLAKTFADELDKVLDNPPLLDVEKLIDNAARPRSTLEAACPSHYPFKEQSLLTVDTSLQPTFLASSGHDSKALHVVSSARSGQHSSTVPTCTGESTAGAKGNESVYSGEGKAQSKQQAGRGRHAKNSGTQQTRIHEAIHEKLARFVNKPQQGRHLCSKHPTTVLAAENGSCTVDASSVEATPLKPTLKTGRRAKVANLPKRDMGEQSSSLEQAAVDSTSDTMGIVAAHQALTTGQEAAPRGDSEEDSDDDFAWIMHRQLPRC